MEPAFGNKNFSVFYLINQTIYFILLVVLKPWLHVPDQMTPFLNSYLYALMGITITGAGFGFVLRLIKQQRKLEEMEARHLKEINEFIDRFFQISPMNSALS